MQSTWDYGLLITALFLKHFEAEGQGRWATTDFLVLFS